MSVAMYARAAQGWMVLLCLLILSGCSAASDAHPTTRSGTVVDVPLSPTMPQSSVQVPLGGTGKDPNSLPPYLATVRRIGPELRARMRFSHRPGCPVAWQDLRYLRMSYVGFGGRVHTGEMVVHEDYAEEVTDVFGQLYDARWPIRRMRLVDNYRGNDDRSMAADNTSGYNCRRVAGSDAWSAHAYGAAIDVNPVQNPYLVGTSVAPTSGHAFAALDRSARARLPVGVIGERGLVVRAFARIGWEWGGGWTTSKDYQHFSASGG